MTVKYCLRNAQSDIVKLIDKTGATLVEYAHLNSAKIAVEVSIFYNSAAAVVNEFHNVILSIAEVIIGVER